MQEDISTKQSSLDKKTYKENNNNSDSDEYSDNEHV